VIWSPDSRSVAFMGDDSTLRKADIGGGLSRAVIDLKSTMPLTGSWGPNGVILAGNQPGILRIEESKGASSFVTMLDAHRKEQFHSSPVLLPDGRHFLYARISLEPDKSGVYIGSLDAKPDEQSLQPLLTSGMTSAVTAARRSIGSRRGSIVKGKCSPLPARPAFTGR
jgi:hypothetical protein